MELRVEITVLQGGWIRGTRRTYQFDTLDEANQFADELGAVAEDMNESDDWRETIWDEE